MPFGGYDIKLSIPVFMRYLSERIYGHQFEEKSFPASALIGGLGAWWRLWPFCRYDCKLINPISMRFLKKSDWIYGHQFRKIGTLLGEYARCKHNFLGFWHRRETFLWIMQLVIGREVRKCVNCHLVLSSCQHCGSPYIGQTWLSNRYFARYNKKQYWHYPPITREPHVSKKVKQWAIQIGGIHTSKIFKMSSI